MSLFECKKCGAPIGISPCCSDKVDTPLIGKNNDQKSAYPRWADGSIKGTLREEITFNAPIDCEGGENGDEPRYLVTAAQLDRLDEIEALAKKADKPGGANESSDPVDLEQLLHDEGLLIDNQGRLHDAIRDYIEGMSVSVDVSTCDEDAGNRLFGVVGEVMDCSEDKHGVTLLVYDVEPNFKKVSLAMPPDDEILDLMSKHLTPSQCRALEFTRTKDGIDCTHLTVEVRKFLSAFLEFSQTKKESS